MDPPLPKKVLVLGEYYKDIFSEKKKHQMFIKKRRILISKVRFIHIHMLKHIAEKAELG